MQANADYWQTVYSNASVPLYPSQFAVFVQSWLGTVDQTIIETGCGNGRDSYFFHGLGHNMVVIDQVICDELRNHADSSDKFVAIESGIDDCILEIEKSVSLDKPVVIYSRFFQHAIPQSDQLLQLKSLSQALNRESILFFEFRLDSDKDNFKEFGTSHFRRFQSAEDFVKTLLECDMECIYQREGTAFARYKNEDPYVGRFVARLKSANHLHLIQGDS